MNSFYTLLSFLTIAVVADEQIPILSQYSVINHPESYSWGYETGNQIAASEQGYLKNPGTEYEGISANGEFRYVDPDGQIVELKYEADENGFRPVGAHLPTSPPIPPAIQRALDYLASLPPQQEIK